MEDKKQEKPKTLDEIKKQKEKIKKKAELEKIKRKYFDYYDDIKISDREDW